MRGQRACLLVLHSLSQVRLEPIRDVRDVREPTARSDKSTCGSCPFRLEQVLLSLEALCGAEESDGKESQNTYPSSANGHFCRRLASVRFLPEGHPRANTPEFGNYRGVFAGKSSSEETAVAGMTFLGSGNDSRSIRSADPGNSAVEGT